jgi:hypothetical protein
MALKRRAAPKRWRSKETKEIVAAVRRAGGQGAYGKRTSEGDRSGGVVAVRHRFSSGSGVERHYRSVPVTSLEGTLGTGAIPLEAEWRGTRRDVRAIAPVAMPVNR